MKVITKKILITVIAIVVTVTLTYAGIRNEKRGSVQNSYDQLVFDQLSLGYKDIPAMF